MVFGKSKILNSGNILSEYPETESLFEYRYHFQMTDRHDTNMIAILRSTVSELNRS